MKTTFCDLSVERVTEGVREKKRETTSGETLQTLSSQSYIRIQQMQNIKPNIEEQTLSAVKLDIVIISLQHFLQTYTQLATDVLKPMDLP